MPICTPCQSHNELDNSSKKYTFVCTVAVAINKLQNIKPSKKENNFGISCYVITMIMIDLEYDAIITQTKSSKQHQQQQQQHLLFDLDFKSSICIENQANCWVCNNNNYHYYYYDHNNANNSDW